MLVTLENFEEVVGRLSLSGSYGLDTETTGLSWEDRLFSIILHDGKDGFYFNFQEYPGHAPLPRAKLPDMAPIFANAESRFFISNAKFDARMLRHEGLEVAGELFCTNAQGRVLTNNFFGAKAYSLDAWAKRLGDTKDDRVMDYILEHKLFTTEAIPGKKKLFKKMRFWEVPLPIVQEYGEHDARLHHKVGTHILNSIGDRQREISRNESALTKVCFDMEWKGIKIDTRYVEKASDIEQHAILLHRRRFTELSGRPYIDSGKEFVEAFKALGITDIPQTEKGNPTFTDDVLEGFENPLAESIRNIRHHEKRLGTYYSSFLHFKDKEDRIHPDLKQGGTETGRFSVSDPNLQNVPKEEDAKHETNPSIVRCSFVPDSGKLFVMLDYSQQEYRMMLDYAGEKKLIDAVMAGADVHQATADLVGISRQRAKTLNFAILYGSGAAKLSKMLGLKLHEAQELRATYFEKLPRVRHFIRQVIEVGKTRGYVVNWAGRKCAISDPEFAYILPNHLIQGGGADVIKFAMVKIHEILRRTGGRSQMVLQIHDEVLLEMDPRDLGLIEEIRAVMESTYRPFNGMRLTTSCEHSFKSWGSPDKVKDLPA